MKIVSAILFWGTFLAAPLVSQPYVPSENSPLSSYSSELTKAIEFFNAKKYQEAEGILQFILESEETTYHDEAYYWYAFVAIAQGHFGQAQRYLALIYNTFPQSGRYEEAKYHHARLNYYTGNYHVAIQELESFRAIFSNSPLVGNSYYWSGLSLLTLGQNSAAAHMFEKVVREYPTSYRVDAARYQLSLLKIAQREENLLEIVRWTHEEYLDLLSETQREADELDTILITTNRQEEEKDTDTNLVEEYRAQVERLRLELDNIKRIEVGDLRRGQFGATESVDERAQALQKLKEELQKTKEEILLRLGEAE